MKTAGEERSGRIVDDLAGIRMTWSANADPQATADQLAGRLKGGKAYHEKWLKYFEALKKWEEEQAKKAKEAKPEPPPKPKEEETEQVAVRSREAGDEGAVALDVFLERVVQEAVPGSGTV